MKVKKITRANDLIKESRPLMKKMFTIRKDRTLCSYRGCKKKHSGKGLCPKHLKISDALGKKLDDLILKTQLVIDTIKSGKKKPTPPAGRSLREGEQPKRRK